MIFEELSEYEKELKTLLKKYRTLAEDLKVVKKVLTVSPDERPPFSYRIDGLGIGTCVIKVKKIACRSLKGRGVELFSSRGPLKRAPTTSSSSSLLFMPLHTAKNTA